MNANKDNKSELEPFRDRLFAKAREEGFDQAAITRPEAIGPAGTRLHHYLDAGYHGDMEWMQTHAMRRADPLELWPAVKSILMLAMNYGSDQNPLQALQIPEKGTISIYAKGKDYHDVIKKKLKNIARWMVAETGSEVKIFVDTAPLMEKPLAASAGLGWQGKHTNLVSRELGSWFFLASILTDMELEPDSPERDHCGNCHACLDICPTKAFPKPYLLDARRCISYLTIEHKGMIEREFRTAMGNRIFGCDDCLSVCPWNKFAKAASEMRLLPRPEVDNPPLEELLVMDDSAFRQRFAGTPIKRTGRVRFVRNCLIAAGNSRRKMLLPLIEMLLDDEAILVRAMAVWALSRLAENSHFAACKARHLAVEKEALVREEWHWAAKETGGLS